MQEKKKKLKENDEESNLRKSVKLHDQFFYENMKDLATAREFFTNFLGKNILSKMNLESTVVVSNKFITRRKKELFADLLYKVDFLEGRVGYIYLLIEHKSYTDENVIFQILEYMAQIYRYSGESRKDTKKVPIVLPILIHHSQESFKEEIEFKKYIDFGEYRSIEVMKYIPDFQIILFDVSKVNILGKKLSPELATFILSLKIRNIKESEIKKLIFSSRYIKDFSRFQNAIEYINAVMSKETSIILKKIIEKNKLDKGADNVGILDLYKEEGVKIGREEGIKEGIKEGIIDNNSKKNVEKRADSRRSS